jgi:hypothetical protein
LKARVKAACSEKPSANATSDKETCGSARSAFARAVRVLSTTARNVVASATSARRAQ